MAKVERMNKGEKTEEIVGHYFRTLGYFVVRGIDIEFRDSTVTDIDLWLYARFSPFSNERTNVDIKDRKSPKAMERIAWASGLREMFGLNRCIVVTSDNRHDVIDFGRRHGVTVIGQHFLQALKRNVALERLSHEALVERLNRANDSWSAEFGATKTLLLKSLDFDGCNLMLRRIQNYADAVINEKGATEGALRLIYFNIASLLVCLDFLLASRTVENPDSRRRYLRDGITFGTAASGGLDGILRIAAPLASAFTENRVSQRDMRRRLTEFAKDVRAEVFADFFAQTDVVSSLFVLARDFEVYAFKTKIQPPDSLSNEAKGVLGVLLDFFDFDRRRFFETAAQVELTES